MIPICIYWKADTHIIRALRSEMRIPQKMTINGETYCKVDEATLEKLKSYESQGLLQLRQKPTPTSWKDVTLEPS